jgi:hypothetical protein
LGFGVAAFAATFPTTRVGVWGAAFFTAAFFSGAAGARGTRAATPAPLARVLFPGAAGAEGAALAFAGLPAFAFAGRLALPRSLARAVGRVFAANFFFAAMSTLIIRYRHR